MSDPSSWSIRELLNFLRDRDALPSSLSKDRKWYEKEVQRIQQKEAERDQRHRRAREKEKVDEPEEDDNTTSFMGRYRPSSSSQAAARRRRSGRIFDSDSAIGKDLASHSSMIQSNSNHQSNSQQDSYNHSTVRIASATAAVRSLLINNNNNNADEGSCSSPKSTIVEEEDEELDMDRKEGQEAPAMAAAAAAASANSVRQQKMDQELFEEEAEEDTSPPNAVQTILKKISNIAWLEYLERRTHIPKLYWCLFMATGLAATLFVYVGLAAVCNFVAFIYPAYLTFKIMEDPEEDLEKHRKWLIYWVVYGLFQIVCFVGDRILFWLPYYELLKLVALVSLFSGQLSVPDFLYRNVILHIYDQEMQTAVDQYINRFLSSSSQAYVEIKHLVFYQIATRLAGSSSEDKQKAENVPEPQAASERRKSITPGGPVD